MPSQDVAEGTSGNYHYHTVITYDIEEDGVMREKSVPVSVISPDPLDFYSIQLNAKLSLENDLSLRSKYGVNSGFIVNDDKFYLLRAYYGVA